MRNATDLNQQRDSYIRARRVRAITYKKGKKTYLLYGSTFIYLFLSDF